MLTDNFCMPSEKRWVTIACPNLAGCQMAARAVLDVLFWGEQHCYSTLSPHELDNKCSHPAFTV